MNVSRFDGCAECMQKAMKPIFFKSIGKCTIFAIWNERNSCGIRCELHKASELGKKIVQIGIQVKLDNITLQEYHYNTKGGVV